MHRAIFSVFCIAYTYAVPIPRDKETFSLSDSEYSGESLVGLWIDTEENRDWPYDEHSQDGLAAELATGSRVRERSIDESEDTASLEYSYVSEETLVGLVDDGLLYAEHGSSSISSEGVDSGSELLIGLVLEEEEGDVGERKRQVVVT
jgi:hypothetical protein